jgi:UDP-N-acetylmuramoyl-L-alanyl-D-glutamate--2,6-diaminopimelate ligase
MTAINAMQLLTEAGIERPADAVDLSGVQLTGLALDSRQILPGSAFCAVRGAQTDGKAFIDQAVQRGAVLILADAPVVAAVPVLVLPNLRADMGALATAFYGHPSASMQICGVTGTNGKTSVSRLVAQLLRYQGERCGVIGTLGATLSDAVDGAPNTTPDPIALQAQLAAWRTQGVAAVAMEVSSHALDQQRIRGLQLHSAVFTNLSRDHLDYHGDMASYGAAKAKLFVQPGLRYAVINVDDPFGRQLAADLPDAVQPIRCSTQDPTAEMFADQIAFSAQGARFLLCAQQGKVLLHSPLRGDFNVMNLLLACAAALQHGLTLDDLPGAVQGLRGIPGRMQLIGDGIVQVVVDYAHTPDALGLALRALRRHTSGRLICVFGAGGDRDRGKRPLMGAVACELADHVVLTSDNPRSEDPRAILDDIAGGCSRAVDIEPDRAQAIARAIAGAAPGDCVLIAGKGHEAVQVIGSQTLPFSDVDHAAAALAERGVMCSA